MFEYFIKTFSIIFHTGNFNICKMDQNSSAETSLICRSFAEYSSDEISIELKNSSSDSKFINPVEETINQVLLHRAKYNTSYAASSNFAETLNAIPGAKIEIPTSKQQLISQANHDFIYERYVFCGKCNILCKVDTTCGTCNQKTKKTKDNYFIFIPVKQQVIATLKQFLSEITEYLNRDPNDETISDFCDGKVYKKVKDKFPDQMLLPLTLNVDGAKIFTSSKSTLWPIQLVQNYLPPKIRFQSKHILLAGIYCGKTKPNISTILLPLALEFDVIRKKGISIWQGNQILHFMPAIIFCACDLPARSDVQLVKPTGYYSCPVCTQRGDPVVNVKTGRSYVRFLKLPEMAPRRAHHESKGIGIEIATGANEDEIGNSFGIKGLSSMIGFENFDLVNGFCIDWMHGVLLGVLPLLLDLWMGKKSIIYQDDESIRIKMLSPKQRSELDRRIISIKPPSRINHKPRSIRERSFYTANEYRSILWFYLPFALKGLLDRRLIEHFQLLSNATFILSKSRITNAEMKRADDMLKEFADNFELFYGKNAVTVNVHILRHYSKSVENTGPLWCNSLFSFESNMGFIKGLFCSRVDVVEQIAFNYCLRKKNDSSSIKDNSKEFQILHPKERGLSTQLQKIANVALNHPPSSINEKYLIGYEMRFKSQLLKSVTSKSTRSADFFIRLHDTTLGAIECFIEFAGNGYVMIRMYEVVNSIGHLEQVVPSSTEKYRLAKCEEICEKLIYMKFNYSGVSFVEVAALEPNFFEGT